MVALRHSATENKFYENKKDLFEVWIATPFSLNWTIVSWNNLVPKRNGWSTVNWKKFTYHG